MDSHFSASAVNSSRISNATNEHSKMGDDKWNIHVAVRFRPIHVEIFSDVTPSKQSAKSQPITPPSISSDQSAKASNVAAPGKSLLSVGASKQPSAIATQKKKGQSETSPGVTDISVDFKFSDDSTLLVNLQTSDGRAQTRPYTFDRIFSPDSTQESLYIGVVRPIVGDFVEGFNGTVMAYGQTGSGKTHTMTGPDMVSEHRGLLPRALTDIFELIKPLQEQATIRVTCSYLQIYMENISDLLNTRKQNLRIMERSIGGVFVENLSEEVVTAAEDALDLLQYGEKNRIYSSTNINDQSSRSHCIFTVNLVQEYGDGSTKRSSLNFVDLAGSEKVSKSGLEGATLEEGKKINQSLSSLCRVIQSLSENPKAHIPYRDSRLTRFLQESLGGNSKTSLILTCSLSPTHINETISTLGFGQSAKTIKNSVHINREESIPTLHGIISSLKTQVDSLVREKKILTQKLNQGGVGIGFESELDQLKIEVENLNAIKSALEDTVEEQRETIVDLVAQNRILEDELQSNLTSSLHPSSDHSKDASRVGQLEEELQLFRDRYASSLVDLLDKDTRLSRALSELERNRDVVSQMEEQEQQLYQLVREEQEKIEILKRQLERSKEKAIRYLDAFNTLKAAYHEQALEISELSQLFPLDEIRKVASFLQLSKQKQAVSEAQSEQQIHEAAHAPSSHVPLETLVHSPQPTGVQVQTQVTTRASHPPIVVGHGHTATPFIYASPMRVTQYVRGGSAFPTHGPLQTPLTTHTHPHTPLRMHNAHTFAAHHTPIAATHTTHPLLSMASVPPPSLPASSTAVATITAQVSTMQPTASMAHAHPYSTPLSHGIIYTHRETSPHSAHLMAPQPLNHNHNLSHNLSHNHNHTGQLYASVSSITLQSPYNAL
eukprot:TRINITY_DN5041_c0_g1_i1.p1 TRINITY_DN5041_c0_g1~~TRINITY_DN5041_c0_g1_i1.p1  ORF type:complete len:890 (-),score=189.00 TRINITY_DN5041_c0_g1_i1:1539-4208(-)